MSIFDHIQQIRPSSILEIGAYRMDDTRRFRELLPTTSIDCIEPDPTNIAHIRRLGLETELNVKLHPLALGDANTYIDFWQSTKGFNDERDWTASGSILEPKSLGSAEIMLREGWPAFFLPPIKVPCLTLDEFMRQTLILPPCFIWCDAQGAEAKIISHGRKALAEIQWLYLEHNTCGVYSGAPGYQEIIQLLPGWSPVEIWPYDVLMRNDQYVEALGGESGSTATYMPDIWQALIEKYSVTSMLDVGSGSGKAAKWFLDHGVDALAIDGSPESRAAAVVPQDRFLLHDFRRSPPPINKKFDLAWSAEFVEHVEERFLPHILACFSQCKYVCLTHATPGQGGHHHVNEQTTDYWIAQLKAVGFDYDDEETQRMRATGPDSLYGRRTLTFFHNKGTPAHEEV